MIDLHTHSTFSDGTLTPTQLVGEAVRAGLSAVALCDHNTVEGLPEFMEAGRKSAVRTVPGVEFSTQYQGAELHILALLVAPEAYEPITEKMEDFRRCKEQSNRELVAALARAGMPVDYEKLRRESGGYVNRAVIATAMMEKGYTASVKEAFRKYLGEGCGYYIPPQRMDAFAAIAFIKSLGAAAVLAHPFLNLEEAALRGFLPEAMARGLDAMEVLYPKYDPATTRLAIQLAEEYGLLPSGGSDFHGAAKPDIFLGVGRGELCVPEGYLTALENRVKSK